MKMFNVLTWRQELFIHQLFTILLLKISMVFGEQVISLESDEVEVTTEHPMHGC